MAGGTRLQIISKANRGNLKQRTNDRRRGCEVVGIRDRDKDKDKDKDKDNNKDGTLDISRVKVKLLPFPI